MKIVSRGILHDKPRLYREYAWLTLEPGDLIQKVGTDQQYLIKNDHRTVEAIRPVYKNGKPRDPWSFRYGTYFYTANGEAS